MAILLSKLPTESILYIFGLLDWQERSTPLQGLPTVSTQYSIPVCTRQTPVLKADILLRHMDYPQAAGNAEEQTLVARVAAACGLIDVITELIGDGWDVNSPPGPESRFRLGAGPFARPL
ncbi:hypothetical protein BJX76DRAFT_337446 [Aspergillus varians]